MDELPDFEIRLIALGDGRHEIVARGPGGEEERCTASLPLRDAALRAALDRLAADDADPALLESIGRRLFDALFPEPILILYSAARGALAGRALRLCLAIEADDDAATLPWEFVRDRAGDALALTDAPLVRYLPQADRILPLALEPPLRVLLTGAQTAPTPLVDDELALVVAALEPLGNRVAIVVEPRLTAARLQDRLREGFHIWHFVGHGDIAGGAARLLLHDDAGDARPVAAPELGVLLGDGHVRLALLAACSSGRVAAAELRSLPPTLIAAGVPAVVAMQFAVSAETTRGFAAEFYRALVDGLAIDACVTAGRRAVMRATALSHPAWGIPVLYTRTRDGRLFDLRAAGGERRAAETLLALPELMRLPDMRLAVAELADDLREVQGCIALLSEQKELHDLLQQVETAQRIIAVEIARRGEPVPDEQLDWGVLQVAAADVEARLDQVLAHVAGAPSVAESSRGLQHMARAARDLLHLAGSSFDPAPLRTAAGMLDRLLRTELPRCDTRMREAAKSLKFGKLVRAIEVMRAHPARDRLDVLAHQRFVELDRDADELRRLDERLTLVMRRHTAFQVVDDGLSMIEVEVEHSPASLAAIWAAVRLDLETLCAGATEPWAETLVAAGAALDAGLAADGQRALSAFRGLRSRAGIYFRQVDKALLSLCGELRQVERPLADVLRML